MKLKKYLETVESVPLFSKKIGKHVEQVRHWKNGHRPVPLALCALIEKVTDGQVSRKDLRPDDWHSIWPELVSGKSAATETSNSS